MTFAHSLLPLTEFIVCWEAHPLVLKIRCCVLLGAKMTMDVVQPSEELTEWYVSGTWRVVISCIRWVLFPFPLGEWYSCMSSQLPGHKGTVTAVDFHPKEPISMFSVSIHTWSDYVVQFSQEAKTPPCYLVRLKLDSQYDTWHVLYCVMEDAGVSRVATVLRQSMYFIYKTCKITFSHVALFSKLCL